MNTSERQEKSAQRKPMLMPGTSLPSKWAEQARQSADVLEQRLDRLEKALGLDPITAP